MYEGVVCTWSSQRLKTRSAVSKIRIPMTRRIPKLEVHNAIGMPRATLRLPGAGRSCCNIGGRHRGRESEMSCALCEPRDQDASNTSACYTHTRDVLPMQAGLAPRSIPCELRPGAARERNAGAWRAALGARRARARVRSLRPHGAYGRRARARAREAHVSHGSRARARARNARRLHCSRMFKCCRRCGRNRPFARGNPCGRRNQRRHRNLRGRCGPCDRHPWSRQNSCGRRTLHDAGRAVAATQILYIGGSPGPQTRRTLWGHRRLNRWIPRGRSPPWGRRGPCGSG